VGGEQIEGRQAVRELLIAGRRRIKEIWLAADLDDADIVDEIQLLARDKRVLVSRVPRRKLENEARTDAPQGVMAFAASLPEADLDAIMARPSKRPKFFVALDGVTDPGNLGAVLRSADGAGVDCVILPRHRSVHVTPTVAKASAGAVEYLPIALVGGLPTALADLRKKGCWVIGLEAFAEKSIHEIANLGDQHIVLVLGAEGDGISRLVRERCDELVAIPLRGELSSLNVSVAAAVSMFEVARHRA
jgi:23S rRNA (guanosine2251-2'-O)-methyltransferase